MANTVQINDGCTKVKVDEEADDHNVLTEAAGDHNEDTPLIREADDRDPEQCCPQVRGCLSNISTNVKSIILATLTLLGHLLLSLVLPIWSSTFKQIKSDVYSGNMVDTCWELSVIFPVFLITAFFDKSTPFRSVASMKSLLIYGMSSAWTGALISFASLPERTPPYLQSILGSSLIPFTVVCRYIMLRKGISLRRGVCIAIAMIGLFITMEPRVWGLTGSSGTGSSTKSVTPLARILWPLCFCLGFVPDAINRVVTEQELKRSQAVTLNYLAYAQLATCLSVMSIFWADLIPSFGMADSFEDFWQKISIGYRCSADQSDECRNLSAKVWLMVMAHVIGYFFHFLLIKHAEGAILASLVQAMRTPIASIFWTLYHYNESGDYLYWSPEFNITTCFLIGGLIIVLPAMLAYNHFSNEEIAKVYHQERQLEVKPHQHTGSINS